MTRSPKQIADELLVLRWQAGDRDALEKLFARWNRRLWRHAFRLTERRDAAADVLQDTWLAMVQGIDRLQDPACFRRWAYQIVTRRAADWIRSEQRRRRADGNAAKDERQPKDASTSYLPPNEAGEPGEDSELATALRRLPAENRAMLALFYMEELSVKEIAHVLSIPEGTVKSRLYHSRQQLKKILERSLT